jgi:hypothetical protein
MRSRSVRLEVPLTADATRPTDRHKGTGASKNSSQTKAHPLEGDFLGHPLRVADPLASDHRSKNYAGTSPITRASGTKRVVLARFARNQRLADAIYLWAFSSLGASPGARAFYDARRAAGNTHHAALRSLGNRLVGILHGCIANGSLYDERPGWRHRSENNLTEAA